MIVFNKQGREIEIDGVRGTSEEPEIREAYYTEPLHKDEVVSDDDFEYIYQTYAAELEEEANEYQIGRAEYAFEGDR